MSQVASFSQGRLITVAIHRFGQVSKQALPRPTVFFTFSRQEGICGTSVNDRRGRRFATDRLGTEHMLLAIMSEGEGIAVNETHQIAQNFLDF